MARQPLLGIVFGKKGVGKTYTTDKLIFKYISGTMGLGAPPRKVLVLDVNNEFTHIKPIAVEDVIKFSGSDVIEARRIVRLKPNGMIMGLDEFYKALMMCLDYFRGGLLLLEDINKYVSASVSMEVNGAICSLRHADTDVILHYQGVGAPGPAIWRNFNWIRFHQMTEQVNKASQKDKYGDYLTPFSIIELMVNNEVERGNQRFYVYFEEKDNKIRGAYSQKMLYEAIIRYIEINFKTLITPNLNVYDFKTNSYKKTDPKEAVKQIASKLFVDVYGGNTPIAA